MLSILNLAMNFWKKNKVSNIMVMIILCLACIITNAAYNVIHRIYSDYNYFRGTPLERSLMYMGGARGENGELKSEYVEKMNSVAAENEDILAGVSKMMKFDCQSDEHTDCDFYVYDKITASYMKKGIKGVGEWLYDSETEDGCYPIVVINGEQSPRLYELGETAEHKVTAYMSVQQTDKIILPKEMTLKCKVVGIIDSIEPFCFFLGNRYGTLIDDARNTFGGWINEKNTTIFFPYIEELFGDYDLCSGTALYYFNDNASAERIQSFYNETRKIGFCTLGSDIIQKTKDGADTEFKRKFFLCYALAGLSLTSILCVSFLNIKKLTKQISIYCLNGCSFIKSTAIYFTYFIAMYGISFLMFLGISLTVKSHIGENGSWELLTMFTTDVKTTSIIFLVGSAVSVFVSLIPFIFIKKKTLTENLKEV